MVFVVNREKLFFYINLITLLKFYLLVLFDHLLKLSSEKSARNNNVSSTRIIETLGSILVMELLRSSLTSALTYGKLSKMILSLI